MSSLAAAVAKANEVVETALRDRVIPGAVMSIAVDDALVQERAFGFAHLNDLEGRPLAQPRPMHVSTIFDLASVTKVMATTYALMLLVDQGKVDVQAPVHTYLTDYRGPELDKITVRHLLTHTAGLVQWQPLYYHAANKDQTYEVIRAMPLQWPVGEGAHYSDLSFLLLGRIAEKVSSAGLDVFVRRALYEPLGLRTTTFCPRKYGFTDFAVTGDNRYERHMVYGPDFGFGYKGDPTTWNGWRDYIADGEVNDGNAWYANGGVAGHAGLFGTAADMLVLLEVLLARGRFQDKQIIRPEVVDLFLKPDAHLGWIQRPGLPAGAFAHTGFTGTYVLGVPEAKLAFVLLTNRQNMGVDAKGYYPDVEPLRAAAAKPLLEALLPSSP